MKHYNVRYDADSQGIRLCILSRLGIKAKAKAKDLIPEDKMGYQNKC